MKDKHEEVIEQLTIRMLEIKETLLVALEAISEIVWLNTNPDSIKEVSRKSSAGSRKKGQRK